MPGLLIVNADDWGGGPGETDAALAAFEAGGITSATAMMHMGDSARAAQIGRERDLALGLHLNLTQAFEDPDTPPDEAEVQARVVTAFATRRNRRFRIDPATLWSIWRTLDDQLEAFRALYGREPTHLDGHNHAHLNPMALSVIPMGMKVRTAHAMMAPTSPATEALRGLRHAFLGRWFRTTAAFYSIRRVHPALGGHGLDEVLELARTVPVEIMTHPVLEDELEILLSDEWRALVADRRSGSYADL